MALIVAAREHHLHDHATVVSPGKAYQRGLPAEAARISFMSEPFPRASLWSADTESHSFRPLAGTTRADVLVVGAGMTGLLTAAAWPIAAWMCWWLMRGPSAGAIR